MARLLRFFSDKERFPGLRTLVIEDQTFHDLSSDLCLDSEGNTAINVVSRLPENHGRNVIARRSLFFPLETEEYTFHPLDSSDSESEIDMYDDEHYICTDVLF